MAINLANPLLQSSVLGSSLQSNASDSTDKSSKIHKAAQQFEALMVGEMLKSAREAGSDGWLGSGESTGDDSAMDMAESQLASALSNSGGLGLTAVIERAMQPRTAQNTADTVPANSAVSSLKKP